MKPLKFEAHLFSDNVRHLLTENSSKYITSYTEHGLLPQYMIEQNASTGEQKNRLFLTNPNTLSNFFVQHDRILYVREFNVQTVGEVKETLAKFMAEAKDVFSIYDRDVCPGFQSRRVSIVTNLLTEISDDKREFINLQNPLVKSFPWCDSPLNEIKVRTAGKITINWNGSNTEICNSVISINDGEFEVRDKGSVSRRPCFLTQIDINTINENGAHRFDIESSDLVFNCILSEINLKIESISELI